MAPGVWGGKSLSKVDGMFTDLTSDELLGSWRRGEAVPRQRRQRADILSHGRLLHLL